MTRRIEIERLGDRIALHAANLDAATHRLLTDVREFDTAGGWFKQGAKSMSQWLSWRVGWDLATAREHVRVATKLGSLPLIDDALRRGELSYSKVRAITRVATPRNEATLLDQARHSTGAQLERICRKYAAVNRHDEDIRPRDDQARRYIRRTDTADGMVKLEAVLHPDEAAIIWAALERVAAELCRSKDSATPPTTNSRSTSASDASADTSPAATAMTPSAASASNVPDASANALRAVSAATSPDASVASSRATSSVGASAEAAASNECADLHASKASPDAGRLRPITSFDRVNALVAIAQSVLRGDRPNRTPTDLLITVPAKALFGAPSGPSDVAVCADGTCLSAAATERLACDCGITMLIEDEHGKPLSIGTKRRTISGPLRRALLRRDCTCRFPGCNARAFLEGHHLKHWARGGATDLRNTVALCSYHHRFVHEYNFTIEGDPMGALQFFDQRGCLVVGVPNPPDVHDSGWPAILADNDELEITCDTPACGWDGLRVDYSACIDALVWVDGGRGGHIVGPLRRPS